MGEEKSAGKAFVTMDRTTMAAGRRRGTVCDGRAEVRRAAAWFISVASLGPDEQSRSHFDLSGSQVIEDHQSGQEFFGATSERDSRANGPAFLAG